MAAGKVDFLSAPEAPGTHHKETDEADEQEPDGRKPPVEDGTAESMHDRNNHAGCRRNWHADEIFTPRATRILRNRIGTYVETRQTACSTDQKEETDEPAKLDESLPKPGIHRHGEHAKAPAIGKDAGRYSEGDDVGERIEFFAEVAGSVGHARDSAIERVKRYRESDSQRGVVEVVRLLD